MKFLSTGLAACFALLLASCGALRDEIDPGTVSVRGVAPTLEQLNVSSSTAAQNIFIGDLVLKAGLTTMPPPRSPDWTLVTEAGIYEISRQCDQYLDVLFRFNRNQRALRQGLTAVGATTATILGLASVAAAPIAITAAAFGLSATLFDAGVNSVLFTIEPSALRNIVLQGRKGYLDDLQRRMDEVNSRPRMMIALQGYLIQCSPSAIEANVNNAASGAPSVASTNRTVAVEQARLAAPAATLIQRAGATSQGAITFQPRELAPRERIEGASSAGANAVIPDLDVVQAALGVARDGKLGNETKTAIIEFGAGMNARSPGSAPPPDRVADLTGGAWELLRTLGPMPAMFQSPFERAFFCEEGSRFLRPQPNLLNGFLLQIGPPTGEMYPVGNTDADLVLKLQMMRKRLGELTKAGRSVPLTAKLFDEAPKLSGGPAAGPT